MIKEKKISVIIAAAGSGKRMGGGLNKQYIVLDGMPIMARSIEAFERHTDVNEILVVVKAGQEERCRREIVDRYGFSKVKTVISGGAERQDSVKKALVALSDDCTHVLIHDGARPFVSKEVIDAVISACISEGAAIPGISVKDTIKEVIWETKDTKGIERNSLEYSETGNPVVRNNFEYPEARSPIVRNTLERNRLVAVQTPQGFERKILEKAYGILDSSEGVMVTDDASLVEAMGLTVTVVEGDEKNIKITTPADVIKAEKMKNEVKIHHMPRVGMGYDVHAFTQCRRLILGGVDIPYERGLAGHSDADVLVHAVMDSLLGACAMGDIGKHFPDTDPAYKDISSLKLLEHVRNLLAEHGWNIINIDVTVVAQKPKIAPYVDKMKANISEVLKISDSQINIKGTTTERLGFIGREEGIAAQSIASIIKI